MKKTRTQWFGLLGVVSFLSYVAAVLFSPLAYPEYDWKSQAVSDLSATHSPSLELWNQLSVLYIPTALVCCTIACIVFQKEPNRLLRFGVDTFCIMNWVSAIGYRIFPLREGKLAQTFQNQMHVVVTIAVVLLSIVSLGCIAFSGRRKANMLSIGAIIALAMMMGGSIAVAIVPAEFFGIAERFSVFAATGYVAVIGLYLFFTDEKSVEK